jgi:type I restriction enzyme S subunit
MQEYGQSEVNKEYLMYVLLSQYFQKAILGNRSGMTAIGIQAKKLKQIVIPLAPLAEQQRIVEYLDKVLREIDNLNAGESKIDVLQKAFPKKMKDSILQYAVEGKLTEQLPSDGDARDLLREIEKEKDRLIKEGKIKKEKPLPEISEDEVPFDIPDNWCWARISDVLLFQEGPGIMAVDFRNTGVPLIRISGLQSDRVTLQGCNYLDREKVKKKWNHFRLEDGDICISTSASLDKVAVVDEEAVGAVPYTGIIRFKSYGVFNLSYFRFFVQTSFYANQIRKYSAGGTIKHYGPSHLRKMIIPVPPLMEQQRIVQRLEELLPEVAKLQINEFRV